MTIDAFIDPTTTSGVMQIVFRGDDRTGFDPYQLYLANGQLGFAVNDDSGGGATVGAAFSNVNQWTEVTGTLDDSNGAMNLYINGNLVASTTTTVRPYGTLTGPNPGLGIGDVESSTYSENFSGLIDEVRISDKALTPSQFLGVPEPSSVCPIALVAAAALMLRRNRPRRSLPPAAALPHW
jgi:hypothetical protein